MKKQSYLDLLEDITKLMKKYGPQTFNELSDFLASPDIKKTLPSLLSNIAELYHKNYSSRKKSKSKSKGIKENLIPVSLSSIERIDEEKYNLLLAIYYSLIQKNILPTLKEIEAFANNHGLLKNKPKTRKEAVRLLIDSMVRLTVGEISSISNSLKINASEDRTLEAWAKVIMRKSQ